MKGMVVQDPSFYMDTEVDEVSQAFSQRLDMHITTVDNARAIFDDAAKGQEHLDETQFKDATLRILNAQESEVPRYRIQGFYQEALACVPVLEEKGTPGPAMSSPRNRPVNLDKFMVWYRKNFYA